MAESKGFEPLRQGYPSTRFPIVLLRPLGQLSNMAPQVGLEPTTVRLTAECSTTELLRNNIIKAWRRPTLTGGNPQLPSALKSLTSVFGMGTGVTSSLSSPNSFSRHYYYNTFIKFCKKKLFIPSKLDNKEGAYFACYQNVKIG